MKSILIGLGTMVIGFFFINVIMMVLSGGRGDTELAIVMSILFLCGVVATSTAQIIKNLKISSDSEEE